LFKFYNAFLSQLNKSPNRMLTPRNGNKVFNPIVIFYTIKMVNKMSFWQLTFMCFFPNHLMLSYVCCFTINAPNINLFIAETCISPTTPPIPMVFSMRNWFTRLAIDGTQTMQLLATYLALLCLSFKHLNISPITRHTSTTWAVLTIPMRIKLYATPFAVLNMFHYFILPQDYIKKQDRYEGHPERRPQK